MKCSTIYQLIISVLILTSSTFCKAQKSILTPFQSNEWTHIYKPSKDIFSGPSTQNLTAGKMYFDWVPNDHTFVKGDDKKWHIIGITHPLVETKPLTTGIHEGEYTSFHAISKTQGFNKEFKLNQFSDLPKILSPADRPGEPLANHAPFIIKKEELFYMFYGPSPMRMASSKNLSNWDLKGSIFSDKEGARDPNVLYHEGTYYLVYCSLRQVRLRKSIDLIHWSEPETIFTSNAFDPESPSLIFHNQTFYLFVCSWDGIWDKKNIQGAYQHKTYVYQSANLTKFGLGNEKEISTLNAHAPEIFQDSKGQWYISSVEWPKRGVSVDKLFWK